MARPRFLDAKEETHGLSESTGAGSNENRPVSLAPIMCDIFDLRLISSLSLPLPNPTPSRCQLLLLHLLPNLEPLAGPFDGGKPPPSHGALEFFSQINGGS